MAPPPPPSAKKCFVADCPYLTSEGLTFEQQLQDIDAHAKYIHRELTIPAPSAPSSAPKPTALPRPDVQEDITEEDTGVWLYISMFLNNKIFSTVG